MSTGALSQIEARGLTKLFGPTPALRGANLEVTAGIITLLSGPNGAGKSTLLNILGTQLRPSRGSVSYLDASRGQLSRSEVRSRLGWVSHASHCYGELTGRQNVELAGRLHGVPGDAVERIAERVGLGRFALRPVSTLSRGQTQRVALARALVHEPELLLLDEPWTGLDQASSAVLERIVLEERDRGRLIVVVSHEPRLAERLEAREIQVVGGRCGSRTVAGSAGK